MSSSAAGSMPSNVVADQEVSWQAGVPRRGVTAEVLCTLGLGLRKQGRRHEPGSHTSHTRESRQAGRRERVGG